LRKEIILVKLSDDIISMETSEELVRLIGLIYVNMSNDIIRIAMSQESLRLIGLMHI
jgi:hypothetical protein